MRWKFTGFFIFAVLVLACTGQRNIDYADRQERLGASPTPLPGEDANGPAKDPLKLINLGVWDLFQINNKTISVTLGGNVGGFSQRLEYSFLVDLESNEVYAIDSYATTFAVGPVTCLRRHSLLCEKFSFKSSIAAFEKLGRFPPQVPANIEGEFELAFEVLETKYGLFKAGPQNLLETYPLASVNFVSFDSLNETTYALLSTYDPLAPSRFFNLKSEAKFLRYRFRCPTRDSSWSLAKEQRTNLNSSMFFACTYLKADDKTTDVESFYLEHVEN